MAEPRRKTAEFYFAMVSVFGQKTENHNTHFLFGLDHCEKVWHFGFHMRQSASKSARTVAEQNSRSWTLLFSSPLGNGQNQVILAAVWSMSALSALLAILNAHFETAVNFFSSASILLKQFLIPPPHQALYMTKDRESQKHGR